MAIQILLIEHDDVGGLYPFTATHCSWELRTGAFTILERWQRSVPIDSITVASHRDLHVRSFVERHPHTSAYQALPTLIVVGHLLVSPSVMRQMMEVCSSSTQPIVFFCNGHVAGTFLPEAPNTPVAATAVLDTIDVSTCRTIELSGHLINRLWFALDHIDESIRWDSALIGDHVDDDASVHSTVVIDESHGPVIIMEGARIGAYSVLTGPTVIGPRSLVKPFSNIAHGVIGPVCKVAGEIEKSIIQGYSNKQHDGFLGHSYLGEWCNLGAGTITSDLKNTYGHVRVHMPWLEEDTQRTFVGLMMGDHSKSAIGTRFTTGTVCGVCCNVVADNFPPSQLPSFTWLKPTEQQTYDVNKAIEVARAVMARRMIDLGPSTEALLRDQYRLTHG